MNQNLRDFLILLLIGVILVTAVLYTTNLGEQEFTGYVVNTQYSSFLYPHTEITMAYGHPNTLSQAKFFDFKVYGRVELEYNQLYRITTESSITQIYRHVKEIEKLD